MTQAEVDTVAVAVAVMGTVFQAEATTRAEEEASVEEASAEECCTTSEPTTSQKRKKKGRRTAGTTKEVLQIVAETFKINSREATTCETTSRAMSPKLHSSTLT